MRLSILVLPFFFSASSVIGEGVYSSITGALTRVKNGITYYLPKFGSCPDMPAQKNFAEDIDDFLGTWFIQSALDHEKLQGQARYMSAGVQYNFDTKLVTLNLQQMNEISHQWGHLVANAKVFNESSDEFKFVASFNLPVYGSVGGTYTLVKSDFKKYGVVHGCGSFMNLLYYDIIWLVSRGQELTSKEQQEFDSLTHDALSAFPFINPDKFKKIVQMNFADQDD